MIQSKDFMSCSKLQQVLAEIARNASAFYRSQDQAEWCRPSSRSSTSSTESLGRYVPAIAAGISMQAHLKI